MSGKSGGSGLGCALVFGGIFLVVGMILGIVGFAAGETSAYNYSTGTRDALGGTMFVLAGVFGAIGVGIVALGFVLRGRGKG
jgi:hypothetical protein